MNRIFAALPPSHAASAASKAAEPSEKPSAEEVREEILSAEALMTATFLHSLQPHSIVHLSFLGVRQNFVSITDLFEFISSLWILVGMKFFG